MSFRDLPFEFSLRYPSMRQSLKDGISPEFARMAEERDRELENFLGTIGGGAGPSIDLGDGAVLTGWSKSWRFHQAATVTSVTLNLEVPGTTNTVTWLTRNGADQVQVVLPAASTWVTVPCSVAFGAGDRWQQRVESAGTGAIGFSAFAGVR